MKPLYFKLSADCERGSYIPIIAGAIFAIITVLGLAIDTGNLTVHQLRLQRALDAAATGAAFKLGQLNSTGVRNVGQRIAADNLRQMKVSFQPSDINIAVDSESVTATGRIDVPLFIMDSVPGFGDKEVVGGTAQAQRVRVIVCLVADVSGSMNCPATGSCSCASGGNYSSCPYPRKIESLISASKSFVSQFSETDDQVALVSFSVTSSVRKRMQDPFVKADMNAILDGFTAGGNTNIAAGISACGNEITQAYNPSTARKAIVLITDGSPTTNGSGSCGGGTYPCSGLYDDAIRNSDISRSTSEVTFYTIGLGLDNGIVNDPYQNANDSNSLKPILLRRVANDRIAGQTDLPFPLLPTYADIITQRKGTYFQTPDANQLQALLLQIGRSIKARLVG